MAPTNSWADRQPGLASPAKDAASVTPGTGNLTNGPCRALYIGVSGDVSIQTIGESATVTFKNVPVGFFPVGAGKVFSVATTASEIIALY